MLKSDATPVRKHHERAGWGVLLRRTTRERKPSPVSSGNANPPRKPVIVEGAVIDQSAIARSGTGNGTTPVERGGACRRRDRAQAHRRSSELSDFDDAPVIAAHARNKGTRRHLKSVYYDTKKRTLWRNGLSLRVRQIGTRFVQTVKVQETEDPLRRGEWEAAVPSLTPDLALAMPFIPEDLRDGLTQDKLETVFMSDIHRHQRLLDRPSGTVEVAFDHGVLTAGEQMHAIDEIELELKGGSTAAIYEIAQRLAEHGRCARPFAPNPRVVSISPQAMRRAPTSRASSALIRRCRWMRASPQFCAAASGICSRRCPPPRMAAIPKACTSCASRCAGCAP